MFSKRHNQVFIHYHHHNDDARWADDFQQLAAHDITNVILSRGFDLKTILAAEDQKQALMRLLDMADAQDIRCIINPGNPRELYLQPDARRWRVDYIQHVAETVGDHPAVHALLLEEHPTGGVHISIERWKPLTADMEGRLEALSLTDDGYQHAIKIWQMEQYAAYTREMVAMIRKIRSSLKTAMSFHVDALFPHRTLVHFQDTAKALDFVIIDAACDWRGDLDEARHLIGFVTDVSTSLTDKDVWVTIGSHVDRHSYQPTLREIREWTQQALDHGAGGIGWTGWDATHWDDRYAVRGAPLAERDQARWDAILDLCRATAAREYRAKPASESACLLSYDSIINSLSFQDFFIPYLILNVYSRLHTSCVSDTGLSVKNALQKRKICFLTPCPIIREATFNSLLAFMENGGWVVASADDCAMDEQMRASDARQRLFGIQQETRFHHDERILIETDLAHLPNGASLPAAWNRTRILAHAEHTRVLGRWGDRSPAVILTPHKKGGAVYIATNPYRAALASREFEDWGRFFRSVADHEALQELSGGVIKTVEG